MKLTLSPDNVRSSYLDSKQRYCDIYIFEKKTAHQIWAQCSNSKWSESVWLGQNENHQISFLFGWSADSQSTPTVWYDIVDLELWAHIWWFSSTHQYCRSAKYEPAATTLSGSTNIEYLWSWDSGTYFSKIVVFWTHGKFFETRFEEVILVKKYFNQNFCSSRTRNSLEKWSYEFSHQNLIFPTRLKKNLGPTVWILLHLRVNGFLNNMNMLIEIYAWGGGLRMDSCTLTRRAVVATWKFSWV